MCHTVPSIARSRVVRRETASTVPVAAREVDDVADPELVLDQDERAGEEVAHERLGAEADRHAEHAGAGQQRREIDPQLAAGGERGDQEDREREDAAQDARKRVDALLGAQARLAGLQQGGGRAAAHRAHPLAHRARMQFGQGALDGAPGEPVDQERGEVDRDDPQRRPGKPLERPLEVGFGPTRSSNLAAAQGVRAHLERPQRPLGRARRPLQQVDRAVGAPPVRERQIDGAAGALRLADAQREPAAVLERLQRTRAPPGGPSTTSGRSDVSCTATRAARAAAG